MAEVAEEFAASLGDLTVNSKPHINMLTMLAEDNQEYASQITQTVLNHLQQVGPEIKLPVLYLIDSIVKNVGKAYIPLFTQAIVLHFANTFEKVDEKTREQMFKLRQTWDNLFPNKIMYALDNTVQKIDPAWPCNTPHPSTVHLNPKFFKPDMIDSKSLAATIKGPEIQRPRHRKSKTTSRSQTVTSSSRSKKSSSQEGGGPAVESSNKGHSGESLREQMLMKQKMYLELQQQKLKMELLQTQAKLAEQQKQLEKQSLNHISEMEAIANAKKLQQMVSQEEAKYKLMDRNLKKHMQMKFPKLHQIHRVTTEMKVQAQKAELYKGALTVPEGLLKPSALLELSEPDLHVKPIAVVKHSKEPRHRIVHFPQPIEKHKVAAPADTTEDSVPPVRIAPASSQLINAALSFGRNVRDPRIRQMSCRLENQLNSAVTTQPPPTAPCIPTLSYTAPVTDDDSNFNSKSRKNKKPSNSQQYKIKTSKSSVEDKHRYPIRSSEKPKKFGKGEKSLSKRSEFKSDKKSKVDELFVPTPKTPTHLQSTSSSRSPSYSHNSKERGTLPKSSEVSSPKSSFTEKNHRKEQQSPKRSRLHNIQPESQRAEDVEELPLHKQNMDLKKQTTKIQDNTRDKLSPESFDSSADMLDEEMEQIVKNSSKYIRSEQKNEVDDKNLISTNYSEKIASNYVFGPVGNIDTVQESCKNMVPEGRCQSPMRMERRKGSPLHPDKKAQQSEIQSIIEKSIVDMEKQHRASTSPSLPNDINDKLREKYSNSPSIKEHENFPKSVDMVPPTSGFTERAHKKEPSPKRARLYNDQLELQRVEGIEELPPENKNLQITRQPESDQAKLSPESFDSSAEMLDEEIEQIVKNSSKYSRLEPKNEVDESIFLSNNMLFPAGSVDTLQERCQDIVSERECPSPTRVEKRKGSPLHQEKKSRKTEKENIMEQLIADAEKHEASPSPPPPPVISDKFKEIKQSSLSRLRSVGRPRDDRSNLESPEPADIDLRTEIQPSVVTKDPKNEVLGLPDKDVDLRNLPSSPSKKRPSLEKLLDAPPAKKTKAEVMDDLAREISMASVKIRYFPARPDSTHWYNNSRICVYKRLFGSEDVDLRPVLCPPPPSPPPPPIISSSPPPESVGWARYKETKPDTYKVKYTPSRRDSAPSVDRFSSRNSRSSTDAGPQVRTRTTSYQKDVDMRAQPPGTTDGSYNQILMQAYEQHQRGDLNVDAYKRVISEVFVMREKRQLEEAQRREEDAAHIEEPLDPISDGDSLSGVEDAPSPTESYSGGEDIEELPSKKWSMGGSMKPILEQDSNLAGSFGDVDIRLPPTDMDIRFGVPRVKDTSIGKNRGNSPYSRRPRDDRSSRKKMRAQQREKRVRRTDEERGLQYRDPRYEEGAWSSKERGISPSEAMDVESPRVPPIPHYCEPLLPARDQQDSTPVRPPAPWPLWLPGMAPGVPRGPPPSIPLRPVQPERFTTPRWRQPALMFDSELPGPRFNRFGPPMPRPPLLPPLYEVPPTDRNVLQLIEEDPTKSIHIDGVPRDIRFYGTKAVAFMNWDDPREVSFQSGSRRIVVDDRDSLVLSFNSPPQEMIIDGKQHRVWFGAPTRELFIDNQWYGVFFGGSPMTCDIGGKSHQVLLEGPPPNVKTGIQRKDLVVGKVSLIIDAEIIFSIFLDAKPQKFEVGGVAYIIRFVEALQKTVINGVAFKSDFGGLPQPIILNGKKHFFRLTALPRGVTPGYLTIVNMEGGRLPSPPTLPAPPQLPASLEQAVDFNPEPKLLQPPMPLNTALPRLSPEVVNREADSVMPLHPPAVPPTILSVPTTVPQQLPPVMNTLDMLTTLMPLPEPVNYSYSVDSETSNPPVVTSTVSATSSTLAPPVVGEVNVAELLQKLMATGIVPKLDQPKEKDPEKPVTADTCLIKPVDFRKPETLKIRQTALIAHLYSGIQCNSCGVRFPPEQTMKYSQHLDWHFRQNRRDKDSTRTAQTRRYYYDVNDWVQFEEIEDLEERAQPWFEMQEGSGGAGTTEELAPAELVSVRASEYSEDAACHICHDKFETFYNEDKEEWQLRNAVDTESTLAHPLCIEDQRVAAERPIVLDDIDISEDEPKEEVVKETKEEGKEHPKVEEDDDIMEVTDIEFIKPVFPVEDLTVSDSESVADKDEEKTEMLEDVSKEDVIVNNEDSPVTEPPNIESSNELPLENTNEEQKDKEEPVNKEDHELEVQHKLVEDETAQEEDVLSKGEDSVPSTTEIMEVVRNIKKDPDALGGEYEEIQDPEGVKKEKGEVPLPAPVVDTTHATVTCLIDGNVEFEDTPQQINVGGAPKIKINITKPVAKDPKPNAEAGVGSVHIAEKIALVNQPPPPGEELLPTTVKERLRVPLIENPPLFRGTDMSALCSIM